MKHIVAALVAIACALVTAAAPAQSDPAEFGLASVSSSLSSTKAGAHPDFETTFEVKTDPASESNVFGLKKPYATTRDIVINLPPGLIGNPNAVTHCSALQLQTYLFEGGGCPNDSQVGISQVYAYALTRKFNDPVYMMDPPADGSAVARLGLIAGNVPVIIDATIRSESDYGVRATIEGAPGEQQLVKAETMLWGVPAAKVHDTERQTPVEAFNGATSSPPRPPGGTPKPFMTNPTRCGVAQEVGFAVDSYSFPGQFSEEEASLPPLTGCDLVGFAPSLSAAPTSRVAVEPTGLDVDVEVPQDESVAGPAAGQIRNAVVSLPEGMTIAAGAAEGLTGCSAVQAGYKNLGASHCPDAAKIGTAEFEVPALSETLQGAVYQRTPEEGKLFRIWLIADGLGVHVKLPGELEVDKSSGQITSIFVDNPQVPLEEVRLHVFGGPRAPLANPQACGTYETRWSFIPWSSEKPVENESPMQIDEGCDTGGFAPRLSAGTVNPVAGSFSPVVTTLTRKSGEENLGALAVSMPPGVLAKIAGVPLCGDAEATTGDCPAGSQVGTTTVATGPGPAPLWIPQPGKAPTAVYLAGPYKGGPYSLVVKTPAQAGPFDLGNVIVRAPIKVDPETTKVTVESDPLPQILEGVPISYRTIHVKVDRPEFTLNPTSCEPMSVDGTATSIDGQSASLADRFQVGSCERLRFKPKLSMRLTGATHRGAFPAFHATLKMPKGGANIARASVRLPHSEFIENAHFRNICTRVQFAAEECPAKSVYGHVVAKSPLLDQPLSGPVYLRSSSHELPDLVADLRGQIHVVLDGRIDSVNGGLRSVFEAVPDAPVSQFRIDMQGGGKGLLVNSTNICRGVHRSVVSFKAQNGRVWNARIPLKAGCGK